MSKEERLKKAKADALERIWAMEIERRKEIVKAVGKERSKQIVIMGNGSLWIRTEDKKAIAQIITAIDNAKVDAFAQWTPAPREVKFEPAIEEWENAGRAVK